MREGRKRVKMEREYNNEDSDVLYTKREREYNNEDSDVEYERRKKESEDGERVQQRRQ